MNRSSPHLRYGVGVLAVGVAVSIKLLLDPLIAQDTPFLMVFGAIMVAAWYGGLGPGLLATVLGALVTDYFFLPPRGAFSGLSLESTPLLIFMLEGVLVCLLVGALRAAKFRSEESLLEAERHQESLRESEDRFRLLVKGVKDYAIFMLDPKGCIASWNTGAERIKGYTAEEIMGRHFSVFFTDEDVRDLKPERELEVASTEGRFEDENWRVRKDGSRFWANVVLTALRDEAGNLRGFSKVTRDITARKEAEKRLREAERRLRTLVEHVPAITYTEECGADKVLTYVSPQVEKVLGYTPEEVMSDPRHWIETMHPEDRERVLAEDERTDRTGEPFAVEYRQVARDGRSVWLRDEAVLVRDEAGNPMHWQGFLLDITERKRAEEKLRESEQLYRNVVEQAAENIFLVDAETKRIIQANAAFLFSLGYTPEETRRLTLYDIVAHDRESIDRNIRRILKGPGFVGERRYRRKDGSLMDTEVSAGAISYGGREALCVVAHDVTERKRAEESLRRSLNALLALYETGQVLSSSLEREEIGSRLLEIIGRVSGTTAAVIYLRDDREGLRAWRTVGDDVVLASVRESSEARGARRAAVEAEEHRSFELPPPDIGSGPLAGTSLPMRVRDRVIGVLEVYGSRRLTESETVETFASLANQAASALENARLYEELTARERQLHDLVGRLLTAQEEERRRVAYDIHDGLAQTVAAAYHHLQAYARQHTPASPRGRQELDRALELIRSAVGEARQIIAGLRPTTLDDFGLTAAIQQQVSSLRSEGLQVVVVLDLGDERLPAEVETTLFRVAQEALTNVRKHARASRVHVTLDRPGSAVRLLVRDEGRGFRPVEVTNGAGPGERVGLSGMRERVSLLGGSFEIRSDPGVGTSVLAEVPLPALAPKNAQEEVGDSV
jgi:PAS domain S-box-containing protein